MIPSIILRSLLPLACNWAEKHEKLILQKGVPLNEEQQEDAYRICIKEVLKIRLLKVDTIPVIPFPRFNQSIAIPGVVSAIAGITFRYGIYIRSDHWNQPRLVVHELAHTMQYERSGGFRSFLEQYLKEWLAVGYPNGFLEQEAKRIEKEICAKYTKSQP